MRQIAENEIFKALADPYRLRLILLLSNGELCVCDLTEVLGAPQSTVSRHLSRLRLIGLVDDRRDGKWVYYSLATNTLLESLRTYFLNLRDSEPYREDARRLGELRKKTRTIPNRVAKG